MKNILGREVPDYIDGYGEVIHYNGFLNNKVGIHKKNSTFKAVLPGESKLHKDLYIFLVNWQNFCFS